MSHTLDELPDDGFGPRPCSYFPCHGTARYVLTLHIEGSAKRRAYNVQRHVCEDHVPGRKKPRASDPPGPGLLDTESAARRLGVEPMTLHQWRHRGKGPSCVKVKNRYWYEAAEIDAFNESRMDQFGAIAREVGVSPESLAAAVRKHAGGRLDV